MEEGHMNPQPTASGKMDLAANLDAEFDAYLEQKMEKNKFYQYKDGFKGENLDEDMEKCPMFMSKVPTQEEIDNNPALAAIQALKYENDDPFETAVAYKEDGNFHFKCKLYKKAIKAYSEGIKQKCNAADLNAVLYSNRAAAHYYLGNLRSAWNDASEALKHKPDHMKAIIRGAQCCFELRKYKDCVQWCDNGIQCNGKEKKLVDLKKKAALELKKLERDRRKKEHEEKQKKAEKAALVNAIQERGITVEGKTLTLSSEHESSDEETEDEIPMPASTSRTNGHHAYLDKDRVLHWPVFILLPEPNQSDFIQDFNENDSFQDHLKVMFGDSPPPWDVERKYRLDNILVYFESNKSQSLVHVEPHRTLKEVLCDKRCIVKGETPSFVVLSSISDFTSEIFATTSVEDF